MTIYVDDYEGTFGRMIMCHMMSDESLEGLLEFAQKLGLKRSWFQNGSAPHYDLSKTKRKLALELGATELRVMTGEDTKEWRRVYAAAKKLKETS